MNDLEIINNLRKGWGEECVCGGHEMDCNEYCCPKDFCMKPEMTALAERLGFYYNNPLGKFIKKG